MRKRTATFQRIRWADNGGEPYCPRCGCLDVRKCDAAGLEMQGLRLSVLGHGRDDLRGPQAADPGLSAGHRDLRERREGPRALQLSRDLDCQYKTAFVLAHKLREAIEAEQRKATFRATRKKSTAPISAATSSRRTKPRSALIAASRGTDRQAASRRRHARARRPHAALRRSARKATPSRRSASTSRSAQSSTPTRRAAGTCCTRTMTCAGSITRSPTARTALAPIRPNPISPPAPRGDRHPSPDQRHNI